MARIETDPNYTAPTFSRATTATDIFKKEDVQGVAEALSLHDHGVGKGLPVTRLGTLTSNIVFASSGAKIQTPNSLTIQASAANIATDLSVTPSGSATTCTFNMHAGSDPANCTVAQFQVSPAGGLAVQSGRNGSGSFAPMSFWTSNLSRMTIGVDGGINVGGVLTAGQVNSGGGIIFGDQNYKITTSAANIYIDAWSFVYIREAGAGLRQNVELTNNIRAPYGGVRCGGNMGTQGLDPTYAFHAPNGAATWGQGQANAWVTYSSRDFKTAIEPLEDPLSIVLNPDLHGVAYNHVGATKSIGMLMADSEDGAEPKEGEAPITETPSIGFVADDWLPHVPTVVTVNAAGKPDGMDYGRVGAITFEALKQLATQVGTLEGRIAALEGGGAAT